MAQYAVTYRKKIDSIKIIDTINIIDSINIIDTISKMKIYNIDTINIIRITIIQIKIDYTLQAICKR